MVDITGIFLYEKFRNEESGFTGFVLDTDEGRIFCQGKIQKLLPNIPIKLTGTYIDANKNYSIKMKNMKTFLFDTYDFWTENKEKEINFLLSLNIEDFGIAKATKLEDYFQDGVFNVINDCKNRKTFEDRCPPSLKTHAKKIYAKIKWAYTLKQLFFELSSAGVSYADTYKLYSKYGADSLKIIQKNPYKIGHEIGLSFNSCEYIAAKAGFSALNNKRAIGILFYAMDMIESEGNTYATFSDLKRVCNSLQNHSLLGTTPFLYILSIGITNNHFIYDKNNNTLQKKELALTEQILSDNIHRLQNSATKLNFSEENIRTIEKAKNIVLSDSQFKATEVLSSTGIKIITGGPGSGKTTLTNIIIEYCKKHLFKFGIVLCAPTGCAAQNMSIKTGCLAETIHRTLGIKPFDDVNELIVTEKRTERIYIIDEASMMDIDIARALFSSIPNDSLVILIGDVDQLPSVNAGCVLQDMIDAGIQTYKLEGSFRQSKKSSIIENAYKIKNGDINLNLSENDFDVFNASSTNEAIDLCLLMADTRDSKEITQVLCPTRKYASGAQSLSKLLQTQFIDKNSYESIGLYKKYGNTIFYPGDRIIMTENNYTLNYFNGEPGIIQDIDNNGILIEFLNNKSIYIENANLKDVSLSYALTVHKSQGAEYDNVIILLTPQGINMMNRNLLYTAVTRAKKKVTIISVNTCNNSNVNEKNENLLALAISNQPQKRKSKLINLIRGSGENSR